MKDQFKEYFHARLQQSELKSAPDNIFDKVIQDPRLKDKAFAPKKSASANLFQFWISGSIAATVLICVAIWYFSSDKGSQNDKMNTSTYSNHTAHDQNIPNAKLNTGKQVNDEMKSSVAETRHNMMKSKASDLIQEGQLGSAANLINSKAEFLHREYIENQEKNIADDATLNTTTHLLITNESSMLKDIKASPVKLITSLASVSAKQEKVLPDIKIKVENLSDAKENLMTDNVGKENSLEKQAGNLFWKWIAGRTRKWTNDVLEIQVDQSTEHVAVELKTEKFEIIKQLTLVRN